MSSVLLNDINGNQISINSRLIVGSDLSQTAADLNPSHIKNHDTTNFSGYNTLADVLTFLKGHIGAQGLSLIHI